MFQSYEDYLLFLVSINEKLDSAAVYSPTNRRIRWDYLIYLAKKNQVQFHFFKNLVELFPDLPELIDLHFKKVEKDFNIFWQTTYSILEILHRHDIYPLVIKTVKEYDYYDSNLDLVFQKEDWHKAIKIIENQGYLPSKSFKEPDKLMYRKFVNQKQVYPGIHFHKAITWNGVGYLENKILWSRKQEISINGTRVWIPSIEDDFLINCAHIIFENYELTLGDFFHLSGIVQQEDLDWQYVMESSQKNGWNLALHSVLKHFSRFFNLIFHKSPFSPQLCADLEIRPADPEKAFRISFPARLPIKDLGLAFSQRILRNFQRRNYKWAVMEIGAYPAFFMIYQIKRILRF